MDRKEKLIATLIRDYEDYLNDFSVKELRTIQGSTGFTMREARNEKLVQDAFTRDENGNALESI